MAGQVGCVRQFYVEQPGRHKNEEKHIAWFPKICQTCYHQFCFIMGLPHLVFAIGYKLFVSILLRRMIDAGVEKQLLAYAA